MVVNQESSGLEVHPVIKTDEPSFSWKVAVLIAVLLFVSENHMPVDVIEGSSGQYTNQMQGSILRQFSYSVIGIIGIVYLVRAKSYRMDWRNPLALAWGSLVVWCTLSLMWAEDPSTSLKRIIAFLLMITGAAGLSAVWSHKQVLQFISLSGAFQVTVGILAEIATGYFTPWVSGYRFAGTQPWNLEGFCCLVFVLSSVAAADADPPHKLFFRCLAVYGLVFLVLTRARGSMMGVAVGFLLYVLLSRSLVAKVSIIVVAAISGLLVYMSGISGQLTDFLMRGGEGTTDLTGRRPLWDLLWEFVSGRPLTGYGYHGFWTAKRMDYFASELQWEVSSTHSMYLDNILTLGYIGLVLHTSVLLLEIAYGSSYYMKDRSPIFALAAAISVAFLLVGYLETVVLISPGPFAFAVTMLLWVIILQRKSDLHGARPIR